MLSPATVSCHGKTPENIENYHGRQACPVNGASSNPETHRKTNMFGYCTGEERCSQEVEGVLIASSDWHFNNSFCLNASDIAEGAAENPTTSFTAQLDGYNCENMVSLNPNHEVQLLHSLSSQRTLKFRYAINNLLFHRQSSPFCH